jgi:hypothetical protein
MKTLFVCLAFAAFLVPQAATALDGPDNPERAEIEQVASALGKSPSRLEGHYSLYLASPHRATSFAEFEYNRFHRMRNRGLRRTIVGGVLLGLAGLGLYALDRMEPEPCTAPDPLVWPLMIATAAAGISGAIILTIGLPPLIKYSRRMEALEPLQGGPPGPDDGTWSAKVDGPQARLGLTLGYRF